VRTIRCLLFLACVLAAAGCGNNEAPVQTQPVAPPPPPRQRPTPAVPGAPVASGETPDGGVAEPPLPKWDLNETDFVEVEGQHRDPFRSYAAMFASERGARVGPQVPVLLSQYAIDDLRLMAIVSGLGTPRAMVIDPTGVGTIVHRGDYIGRGEVVRGGGEGAAEFEINWRIDKIRSEDIVLAREDPASPGGTPVTRILPLHPEGDVTAASTTPTSPTP
jgi:type IV pilus assembly protein PilP